MLYRYEKTQYSHFQCAVCEVCVLNSRLYSASVIRWYGMVNYFIQVLLNMYKMAKYNLIQHYQTPFEHWAAPKLFFIGASKAQKYEKSPQKGIRQCLNSYTVYILIHWLFIVMLILCMPLLQLLLQLLLHLFLQPLL